jgi:hypothetical protein
MHATIPGTAIPRIAGGSGGMGTEEHSPDAPDPAEAPARYEHGDSYGHAGAASEVPGEERQTWPDLTLKEALTLVPLAILTIFLGVYPQAALAIAEPALQRILDMMAR